MKNNPNLLIKAGMVLAAMIVINLLFLEIHYLFSVLVIFIFVLYFLYAQINTAEVMSFKIPLDNKKSKIDQEIRSTLSKISTLLSQQVNVVDTEIDRASILIKDAVEGLSESFKHFKM